MDTATTATGREKNSHSQEKTSDKTNSSEDPIAAEKATSQETRIPRKRPRQHPPTPGSDPSTHPLPSEKNNHNVRHSDMKNNNSKGVQRQRWGPKVATQEEVKDATRAPSDNEPEKCVSVSPKANECIIKSQQLNSTQPVETVQKKCSPSNVAICEKNAFSNSQTDDSSEKNGEYQRAATSTGFQNPTFIHFSVKSDRPLGITASNTHNLDPSITLPFWVITRVKPGTQAEELGVEVGDVIFSIGGKGVTTKEENLVSQMKNAQSSGNQYEIVVCHENTKSSKVTAPEDIDVNSNSVNSTSASDNAAHLTDKVSTVLLPPEKPEIDHPHDQIEKQTAHPVREENAILPAPGGRKYLQLYDVHLECKRRTKRICVNLCLLPQNNSVTLSDAINLVFASLNYEAPNSSYDPTGNKCPWICGSKPKLVGPQPWMATRKFVVERVEELLEAEGIHWIESTERREQLKLKYMSFIHEYLITWRPILSETSQDTTLKKYAENVWTRFTIDHLSGGRDVLKFHKLTESYVHFVASKLQSRKMCPHIPACVSTKEDSFVESTSYLKALITKNVKKIWYDVIPFAQDINEVSDTVWERLDSNFVQLQSKHISPLSVRDVLDDLEDDSNFLSYQNGLYKVRVNMSALHFDWNETGSHDTLGENSEVAQNVGSSCFSAEDERSVVNDSDISVMTEVSLRPEKDDKGNKDTDYDDSDDDLLTKTTWEFSTTKNVGARVYAEFTNGEYYWGHIGQIVNIRGSSKKKYFVQFEDGDFLEDIPEHKVYSETDYKKYFEIDPPPPPEETDQEKRWRRRGRNMRKSDSKSDTKKNTRVRGKLDNKKRNRTENVSLDPMDKKSKKESFVVASLTTLPDHEKKQEQKPLLLCASDNDVLLSDGESCKEVKPVASDITRLSPRMLRKIRCKKCFLCKMRDCGQCMTCIRNSRCQSGSSKEVCLRKMCCEIPVEAKAQPAVGFPTGWTFIFGDSRNKSFRGITHPPSTNGLSIIAPNGRKFHSVEAAKLHNKTSLGDVDTVSQEFLAHIGVASYTLDSHHFLVGKGYCHEWTDVKGRKNILFGVITRCSKDSKGDDDVMFTVEYSDESAAFVNNISNSFGCPIPSAQLIPCALAWGGCVSFERKHKSQRGLSSVVRSIDKSMSCKSWVTPDMRIEEMIDNGSGLRLPKLTIIFRGFKLVFTVKKSSKLNAGNGLFVKCTSLLNDVDLSGKESTKTPEQLFLNAGELLDLGIYAPFRAEDKKHECIFKLKNYIYSQACEDWCFNAMEDDHQYDITDDLSGEVHSLAKQHVLMYVNECGMDETPTIHAEFDPEGSVHYLLGISYSGSWKDYESGLREMNIKAGGDEVEVFVNYGHDYERARLRKGYSEMAEKDKERALEEMKANEIEFVQDIKDYTLEESIKCIHFFHLTFSKENLQKHSIERVDEVVKSRCLRVLNLLESRMKDLVQIESKAGMNEAKTLQTVKTLIEEMKELETTGPSFV